MAFETVDGRLSTVDHAEFGGNATEFRVVLDSSPMEPEDRHRRCWYSRRTVEIPIDIGAHTIEDGALLYCAHPMLYPVVGFAFDVRNCTDCDYFRERRATPEQRFGSP